MRSEYFWLIVGFAILVFLIATFPAVLNMGNRKEKSRDDT